MRKIGSMSSSAQSPIEVDPTFEETLLVPVHTMPEQTVLFTCKEDLRTKIISLSSGTVIVYQLPATVDLESFRVTTEGTDVVARDDGDFRMDLSEGVLHLGGETPGVR